jgi:hypothetical protein
MTFPSRSTFAGMETTRLWHGGAPDLKPGDPLLPPIVTGVYSRLQISLEEGATEIAQRPDLVYATTYRTLARAWAGVWTGDGTRHGGGALYIVELDDPEPDDDLLPSPGLSYQASSGRIVSVYDPHVSFDPKYGRTLQRLLAAHATRRRQRGVT